MRHASTSAVPLHARERTIPTLLRRSAELYGDKPCVSAGERRLSYEQVLVEAALAGGTLAAAGVERGDRVAFMAENRVVSSSTRGSPPPGWARPFVPLNTATRGPQLEQRADELGAAGARDRGRVSSSTWTSSAGAPAGARAHLGPRRRRAGCRVARRGQSRPCPATPCRPSRSAPGDTVAILYTSGTTGPSKGVMCPQAQFYWWGEHVAMLEIDEDDVLYTCCRSSTRTRSTPASRR